MTRSTITAIALAGLSTITVATAGLPAVAQEWPGAKPVRMIIGFAPGGGADITTRLLFHPYVEDALGQKVIFENMPGANGEISYSALAQSAPDGYTIAWTSTPGVVSAPVSHETTYDLEDLAPVVNVSYDPGVLVAPASSPFNSLADVIAYAKDNPGNLLIGQGGLGGDDFLAVSKLQLLCECSFNPIPYPGGTGDQITAVLGEHVQVAAMNASEVTTYLNDGTMKVLGVMSEEAMDILPGVPTFKAEGIDLVSGAYRGFSAPAGTPPEYIQKLADAVAVAMESEAFKQAAANQSLTLRYMGPEEYTAFLQGMRDDLQALFDEQPW